MEALLTRPLFYLAFLGTAVATIAGGQQVNLALLMVLIVFTGALVSGSVLSGHRQRMTALKWFMLASLPATLLYWLRGGPPLVPVTQYVGIAVCWIAAWTLFRHLRYSPSRIFAIYLRCAQVAAIVGIYQQMTYLMGIPALYDIRWLTIGAASLDFAGPFMRVHSLFTEPSYFAAFLMPALYFSILRLSGASRVLSVPSSALFIAALLCTFSTIGYIGLALCVVFSLRMSLRNLALAALMLAGLLLVAGSSPAISSRMQSIPSALQSDLQGDENLSALINGVNLSLATSMINDRPYTGLGLGAYRVYSLEYLEQFLAGNSVLVERLNAMMDELTLADGGSMYLRLPTEIGLLGCGILAWLIHRGRRSGIPRSQRNIAKAALLFIVVFSIRSGQLIRFDLVFFFALYSLIWFRTPIAARRPRLAAPIHNEAAHD